MTTRLFEHDALDPDLPRTHAFVIGVGGYPHAKPGRGHLSELRDVADLPSAADSAKFMCDWLIQNSTRLAAPMASLEILISDAGEANDRYIWTHQMAVDPATEQNILTAGADWLNRLNARPGDVAFFYCCGHGAVHKTQPVLFLEDLNRSVGNPWSHLNIGGLAQSLRRNQIIGSAFMFADACGEFLAKFELGDALECRFFPAPVGFRNTRNNVSLICGASENDFAYDGDLISFDEMMPGGNAVRLGRFTQVLVKALGGASARYIDNRWTIDPSALTVDLKKVRRIFFDTWDERTFEPMAYVTPADIYPIAFYGEDTEIPIVILTDPAERVRSCDLFVSEQDDLTVPWLKSRYAGSAGAWLTTVPTSKRSLYAIAQLGGQKFSRVFTPEPLLKQLVGVV